MILDCQYVKKHHFSALRVRCKEKWPLLFGTGVDASIQLLGSNPDLYRVYPINLFFTKRYSQDMWECQFRILLFYDWLPPKSRRIQPVLLFTSLLDETRFDYIRKERLPLIA